MTAVLVLAKAPGPGRVKTRLCPPCTPEEAAALAEAALADTLAAVAAAPAGRRAVVLDGRPGSWLPPGFEVLRQRGNGLDERLAFAFRDAGGPAVLLGMDTPQVTPAHLAHAVGSLEHADAVLGLSPDGGFWLVGLRRPQPRAFLGIPMSAPTTGRDQARRLRDLGLSTVLLPMLRDVDTVEDGLAVARTAPGSRFARRIHEVMDTRSPVGVEAP